MAALENLLFTFVLSKRGVPDVETIYLVLIKKRELLSEITRCVSDHENELTCLANK